MKGGNDVNVFILTLVASIVLFPLAFYYRSWILMFISGVLILPMVWYLSMTPRFYWAFVIPIIHLVLSFVLYHRNKNKQKLSH